MKPLLTLFTAIIIGCITATAADPQPMMDNYSGQWGFADQGGYMIIKARYENVRKFREGLAAVQRAGKYGFVDIRGRIVVKIKYDQVDDFNKGFAIVRRGTKWGAVNRSGDEVIPCQFDTREELNDLTLESDGKTMTIRSNTRVVDVQK